MNLFDNPRSRNALLLAALALHTLLWIFVPTWFQPNANLDVVEGVTWGMEWEFGYDKHPPLAPWFTYLATLLSPGANWPIFLLAQVSVVAALVGTYLVARRFVDSSSALIACLMLTMVPYYNFMPPEFNVNFMETPLWAMIGFFGLRAINHDRMLDWILLGVFGGLAMLSKYFSVTVLFGVFAYFLTPHGWKHWRNKGMYVALGCALLTWLPNLIWLIVHDFSSVNYGVARGGGSEKELADHFVYPAKFIVAQLLILIFMLPAFFFALRGKKEERQPASQASKADRTFLTCLTLGPIGVALLISGSTGMEMRSMWGVPLFNFLPLWLIVFFGMRPVAQSGKTFMKVWSGVTVFIAFAFFAEMYLAPKFFDKSKKRAHFPGEAMAVEMTQEWDKRYSTPLDYVVGSIWIGGNMTYYSKYQPSILYDADYSRSPWIDAEDFKTKGGLIVWNLSMDGEKQQYEALLTQFPHAQIQPPKSYAWHLDTDKPPVEIAWAIIPPAGAALATPTPPTPELP
ncbi:MAG: glycosyltransferase family 39 protein [Pontibacterium sp.]